MHKINDPLAYFQELLARAKAAEHEAHEGHEGVFDPTAVSLGTVDQEGRPSVRMVLLKGVDERGFLFFTNYGSRKARELADNPQAALCVHWPRLAAQVRVEGTVERVSAAESDAYFATRPRGSQLAAWASRQSEVLDSREALMEAYRELEGKFAGKEVPRPPFWGGYRLLPRRIEFWQGWAHRLHDRVVYLLGADGWSSERLYP